MKTPESEHYKHDDHRPVTVTVSVKEARAMLCQRYQCEDHSIEDRNAGFAKLAAKTRVVTTAERGRVSA